jgi:hypothetical protein
LWTGEGKPSPVCCLIAEAVADAGGVEISVAADDSRYRPMIAEKKKERRKV